MRKRCSLLCLALIGCSGASPPPAAPAPPPAAPVPAAPAEPAAASSTAGEAPSGGAGADSAARNAPPEAAPPAELGAPASDAATPRPSTPPIAMITARDVAYLVDYANSAPRKAAENACEKEASGDPALRGACLQKARDKFQADVLRFQTDEQGRSELRIYKRAGSSLSEVYVTGVEFADETPNSVRVKLTGKTRGQRPLFRNKKDVIVGVPNDYSIELEDPELGTLTYNAKIGLVSK